MAAARYQEIAGELKEQIGSGVWGIGDQLPTEQVLIAQYSASRSTIRQALQDLRDAGLVQVRHGVGVFVPPPKVVERLDPRERLSKARRQRNGGAFLTKAKSQNFPPSSNVRVWFESAQDFAELLGVPEHSEVCVRDRVMRADGQPVMLAVSRLPREITRETVLEEVDTGPGGAFARLEELGFEITYHEELVGARTPDTHERQALALGSGPLLTVRRRTWSGDRVVEINDMKMSGAGYELRYAWAAE